MASWYANVLFPTFAYAESSVSRPDAMKRCHTHTTGSGSLLRSSSAETGWKPERTPLGPSMVLCSRSSPWSAACRPENGGGGGDKNVSGRLLLLLNVRTVHVGAVSGSSRSAGSVVVVSFVAFISH